MSFAASIILAAGIGINLPVQVVVPSGQKVDLFEVLIDEVGAETWLRFRFLTPEISPKNGRISFAQAEDDFEHLCTHVALPYLDSYALSGDVVVVTLLDVPVEFGASDPDVTQYIDVFRISSGRCVWEGI